MPSAPVAVTWRPAPFPRVRSWLGDWLVVSAWLGVLTMVSLLVLRSPGGDGAASSPGPTGMMAVDLAVTVMTVVPYVVYLSATESSRARATVGKRWAGLVVAGAEGERAGTGQVWLRNIVKALPWQLAHLGVSRAVLEVQLTLALTLNLLSLLLAAVCTVPALVGGRGLHDRVAGTRVQRRAWSAPGEAASP